MCILTCEIIQNLFYLSVLVSHNDNIPYSVLFSWGKIFVVFVVGSLTTNILPTNEATLPTFTCSASSNHENITHEMSQYC